MTERFLRYYHHAVPFDRVVIERAWARCRDYECVQARRQVEEQLGPIGRAESRERE
jgi:hypothetical protein